MAGPLSSMPRAGALVRLLLGAALLGLYSLGGVGWVLGFVALVPWLQVLDGCRSWKVSLLWGWAMSVACTAAAFSWFGVAIGQFTGIGTPAGLAVLLLAAPLFQPQFIAFVLVRQAAGRWFGPLLRALAAAAAWVAAEALVPKLLGDTMGHGLYPSRLARQAADLGGAAGLTLVLLLANEAVCAGVARRALGWRATLRGLAPAAALALLLAGYGLAALTLPDRSGEGQAAVPLRVALLQSNMVDYERLRRERGAGAVVREVLDLHFAMSYDAVERQHAQAVLWSETVYPTTFAHPKSEAGAEFDREILEVVRAAGVPFVFGTYDRDAAGEYNAAAFVSPRGLLGFYRKTRPFLFTEYVPAWLDGPWLRRWLPWAGTWLPGTGARVFPLQLADGREIPVLPLICRDDVDTGLAVEGARQGARALLTMSNDSWFTDHPQGAALHQAAAAFRSIETRLPQFRVTTNGYSAVIDATGTVIAGARMGERTLVIGELPVRDPPQTLVVRWGDWVGRAAGVFLLALALAAAMRATMSRTQAPDPGAASLPADVVVMSPAVRLAAAALRIGARAGLLWMVVAVVKGDGPLASNTLAQLRTFGAFFLAPEAAALCLLRAFAAHASVESGSLVLTRGRHRMALALADIASVVPWRLPVPGPGLSLLLKSGGLWRHGLAHADPAGLARALAAAGAVLADPPPRRATAYALARRAWRQGRLDRPLVKFGVLPLALAVPAFRLHQHIAYGGTLGEYYTFGLKAYLATFALWWGAWVVGVVLCAAVVRAAIEGGTVAAVLMRPAQAPAARRWLEQLGRLALYLGLPAWLALRMLGG